MPPYWRSMTETRKMPEDIVRDVIDGGCFFRFFRFFLTGMHLKVSLPNFLACFRALPFSPTAFLPNLAQNCAGVTVEGWAV